MALLAVTGGTGFVMSHLVREWLASDPAAEALLLDLNPPDQLLRRYLEPYSARWEHLSCDLAASDPFSGLGRLDEITHFVQGAAVTSINQRTIGASGQAGLAGAQTALQANIMGSVAALTLADSLPNLHRYIQVSTGSVYAPEGPDEPGQPLPEEGYIEPDGFYGISKWSAEQLALQCRRQWGLPVVAVRFSSVYGEMDRDTPARQVALAPRVVAQRAVEGGCLRLALPESQGDYIHADCLARALCMLLRSGDLPSQEIYNVALGQVITLQELVDMAIAHAPGLSYEVVADPSSADLRGAAHWKGGRWGAYDISRLRYEFGWQPRPLAEALAGYIDWLAGQGEGR